MTETELVAAGEPTSASLEQDIRTLVSVWQEDAPLANIGRLTGRASVVGHKSMQVRYYKSVLAEEIYLMKTEEDWQFFINTDTGETFQSWDEFHERLVAILPISESASWYYQKVVRFAYQVLGVEPGKFAEVGGLTTAGKMLELSVIDGYSRDDWANNVRPATVHFEEMLKPYGETHQEQMENFFHNAGIKHDYEDPSAINKPPKELGQMVDEFLGRPKIWFTAHENAIQWHVVYADGAMDVGLFTPDKSVPPPVKMEMARGLRVRDRQ